MSKRFAGVAALMAFFLCLVTGLQSGNTFSTTVGRAILALAVTLVIGTLIGALIENVVDENLSAAAKKIENSGTDSRTDDR